MKDTDYAYAVARIRANERYLLSKSDIERLISSKKLSEALGVLKERGWSTDGEYAALHRVAVAPSCKGRGVGGEMVAFAEARCRESGVETLRGDTHEQNRPMRRLLEKSGFSVCGRIVYPVAGPRLAYEKILADASVLE